MTSNSLTENEEHDILSQIYVWFPALLYGPVIPNRSGKLAELIVYIIPPEWICIVTKSYWILYFLNIKDVGGGGGGGGGLGGGGLIQRGLQPRGINSLDMGQSIKKCFRPPYLFQNKIGLLLTLGIIMIST